MIERPGARFLPKRVEMAGAFQGTAIYRIRRDEDLLCKNSLIMRRCLRCTGELVSVVKFSVAFLRESS